MDKTAKIRQTSVTYNYALSQLFGPSLLKKIHNDSDEQSIKSLIEICKIYPNNEDWNLIKGLESAYNHLKQHYRCEYIYKNEIANQLLLKFHSDNSATLLKEVASDSSIADIVIINGDTVAYEIKTELDSFERLPNQINSYQAIYDSLYIVTYPGAAKALFNKVSSDIGIIVLDNNSILQTIRKATKNTQLFNSTKAVLTLRQSELVAAYEKYVGKMPIMGTALIHTFCYEWYLRLDKFEAQIVFAEALKSRRPSAHQFDLIKQCNPALTMLFLGKAFSKKYCIATLNRLCIFD